MISHTGADMNLAAKLRRRRAQAGILAVGVVLFAASVGDAASDENSAAPNAVTGAQPAASIALGDDELFIREVFQSHLPATLKKSTLRLWVHPHLGDLHKDDHLRISTGVRHGLSKNWEISVSSDLYFSHGLGDVRLFDRYGAANLQLGTKVNLQRPFFTGWDTAVGMDFEFPTGRPPSELTDGLRHFVPYVTFSHRLSSRSDMRVFWGLRLDDVTHTPAPGASGKNDLRDDSTGATGGFVIDRKNWHYTFETSFDTTRLIGHSDADVLMIRPGVIWEILSRRNPPTRGNWVVGAAVRSTFGHGGTSLGASLKLRYNFNLESQFRDTRPDPTP